MSVHLPVPAESEGVGGWESDEPSQLCGTFSAEKQFPTRYLNRSSQ